MEKLLYVIMFLINYIEIDPKVAININYTGVQFKLKMSCRSIENKYFF